MTKTEAPCLTRTSHVPSRLLAEKTDTNAATYSDGDYAMFGSVTEGDIKPGEDGNPVKTLRRRYDAGKKAGRPVRR